MEGLTGSGSELETQVRGEVMRFLEYIIERMVEPAGSELFAAVVIKVSSLYKYVGVFF